jgi:hypothetical protein
MMSSYLEAHHMRVRVRVRVRVCLCVYVCRHREWRACAARTYKLAFEEMVKNESIAKSVGSAMNKRRVDY